MFGFYKRIFAVLWTDFSKSTREQVVGALLVVAILILQIHYGVITPAEVRSSAWAIAWPYVALVVGLFLYHAVRAPWKLDKDHLKKRKEIEKENEKLRDDLADIGGPQLMIGYIQANSLAVQNNGGGTAYTIVLRVPEDGSIFSSKPINILKENSDPTIFNLTGGQAIQGYMFVTRSAKGLPVVVECTDGDCCKFVYRFEKMKDSIGFLLKGKQCVGKASMPHPPTPQ